MGVVHADSGIAYDANAAVDGAMRYASANASLGAEDVRKLVKAVKMIADPDMEEYLLRMTEKCCEHVFNVLTLITSIDESNADEGLKLIAVVRELFVMGMIVSTNAPLIAGSASAACITAA